MESEKYTWEGILIMIEITFSPSAYAELAVFNYVKDHPDCKSSEIADALYETICINGRHHKTFKRNPILIKREWASKLLQKLKKKGLVYYPHINQPRWRVRLNP